MQYLVDSSQMKEIDHYTIEKMGISSLVLMERASLAVVEELEKSFCIRKTLILCGSGNNGGDGMAIARILYGKGYDVAIYLTGKKESFTKETETQWNICKNYGVPVVNNLNFNEYTTIVDAVFGVGLSRDIQGAYQELIEKVNTSGIPVLSVDMPSGVHGSTGKILGVGIRAKKTVTFAYGKLGLYMEPGASYAGDVIVKDIGIYNKKEKLIQLVDENVLQELPFRNPLGNKGTFGKVLLVAGSTNMCGAAYFAGKGALLSGAGMVKIFTERKNRTILQQQLPEALLTTYHSYDSKKSIKKKLMQDLEWANVVAVGPGLGQSDLAEEMVHILLEESSDKPMLLDADGLNILSKKMELLKQVQKPVILTPHMGEMARLCDCTIEKIKENPLQTVQSFLEKYSVTLVMKDAHTWIGTKDGIYLYKNDNSGMATAGSGDVLTGITAGLMASGVPVEKAGTLAVYIHGKAGECARNHKGERSMIASDILEGIWEVLS